MTEHIPSLRMKFSAHASYQLVLLNTWHLAFHTSGLSYITCGVSLLRWVLRPVCGGARGAGRPHGVPLLERWSPAKSFTDMILWTKKHYSTVKTTKMHRDPQKPLHPTINSSGKNSKDACMLKRKINNPITVSVHVITAWWAENDMEVHSVFICGYRSVTAHGESCMPPRLVEQIQPFFTFSTL